MAPQEQPQAATTLSSIVYSAGTDVGMRREENQDSYGIMLGSTYRLFIVADGMGGVQGGAIASNLAITTIERKLRDKGQCSASELTDAVQSANVAIHERGKNDAALTGMGTTLVGMLCTTDTIHIANVGDSRLYRIRSGEAKRLTEDHTLVQELVRSGAITEAQAEHHPVSHMLTRSLGPSPRIEIDCYEIPEKPLAKDKYLLCSDGLYNMVKEHEIGEIVATNSTDDAVQILIDLANERGGSDNITIVIIDLGSEYPNVLSGIQSEPSEEDEYLDDDLIYNEEEPAEPTGRMVGGYHETHNVTQEEEAPVEIEAQEVRTLTEDIISQPVAEQYDETVENEAVYEEEPVELVDEIEDLGEEDEVAPEQLESPATRTSRLPLLAGGFFGGIVAAFLILKLGQGYVVNEAMPPAVEPQIASSSVQYAEEDAEEPQRGILPSLNTVYDTAAGSVESSVKEPEKDLDEVLGISSAHMNSKIGPAERTSIIKRKEDLRNLLAGLEVKLEKFDKPLSGELGDMLKESTKKAEEVQAKIDQIKADTDLATRKLATWYERKRRLETTDAINMAGEIAVSIPAVKQKKDEFERSTWDYLREVEALRYSPGDRAKESHVSELVKIRADKMKELAEIVRTSVEKALSDADHGIAELTVQRSILEGTLATMKGDLDFVRTVTGNDEAKRRQLKADLLKRQESARTELQELEKLLPQSEEAP